MRLLHQRCAALDVHKKSITACIRQISAEGETWIEQRTFGTFTSDLSGLGQWLMQSHVIEVAMESTGVYWIPVWNVLEDKQYGLNLTLVNPAVVKAMPGSKTDAKDAARIAELHQYGLLRGSFIPPVPVRQLRDLTRRRTYLQQEMNRVTNRIEALLERANVKLSSVVSHIGGVSSLRMLYAISEGETDPWRLAGLAVSSLKAKQDQLARALKGNFTDHLRWQLGDLLDDLRQARRRVWDLENRIRTQIEPWADLVTRLRTIPGVDEIAAWVILSEIGPDMSQFPSAGQLANWVGMCPGNDESAGKRRSGRARKGNRHLRRILIQCGWAARNKKDCFLASLFQRISYRRGMKRAACAVAHRILIIIHNVLANGTVYRELGGGYHANKNAERTARRLTERLEGLGYRVSLEPVSPIPSREIPVAAVAAEDAEPASIAGTETAGEPGTAEPRKRGRPPGSKNKKPSAPRLYVTCRECAMREIPCIHTGPKAIAVKPAPTPKPRRTRPNPALAPALPSECPRCAAWGIPCIHARNKLHPKKDPSSDLSAT